MVGLFTVSAFYKWDFVWIYCLARDNNDVDFAKMNKLMWFFWGEKYCHAHGLRI